MKKIKKISYPDKYDELIKLHGEEKGNIEYYKFIRGSSLEKYVFKYGENANKYWNEHLIKVKNSGVSLEKMILKYGKHEGEKKYKNWKEATKQNLEGFIKRWGDEEGKRRYEIFREKSLSAIKKIDRKTVKNQRNIKYWVNLGYTKEESILKVKELQNTSSLDSFISRYGEDEGKRKYIEVNKLKSITINNMIRLYGENEGKRKYDEYIIKLKYAKTIEYFIKKYGTVEGAKIYKDIQKKKINNFVNMYSLIGIEFCENVVSMIKNDFKKIYYGDNEYKFFVWEDGFKIIVVDLYIKDINTVIEFYGDYWHRNPKIYNIDKKDVKEIHTMNEKRIHKLKEKFNSNIIIVWENDYKNNKQNIINLTINEIYKIKNNYEQRKSFIE